MYHMSRTLPIGLLVFLVCGLVVAKYTIYTDVFAPRVLTVSVFNVGKGTATLIRAPSGRAILVDTGSDASILRSLGSSLPMWDRSLDAVILTGASSKVTGGLPDIQKRYRIAQILRADGRAIPYGTSLTFDKTIPLTVIAPQTFTVSSGSATLLISSSTSPGTYISNGTFFLHK